MPTRREFIEYLCDQAQLGARLEYRMMFGEYALYLDGKVVAFVCDNQLFLKPTGEGRTFLGEVELAPPYPGARDYFLLSSELDEPDRLRTVLEITARVLKPLK